MLVIWIYIVTVSAILLFAHSCNKEKGANSESSQITTADSSVQIASKDTVKVEAIVFSTDIMPILKSRCSPCHFPDGKMYERLPFDQAQTLLDNHEGILRRIKDESENQLMKDFVEQNSSLQ